MTQKLGRRRYPVKNSHGQHTGFSLSEQALNIGSQMPTILSPVRSFTGAVRVIAAGADEIYCGVLSEILANKGLTLYRGAACNIPTYDELGRIVKYAHDRGVKVALTANLPFMTNALKTEMKSYIRSCVQEGIDALIIGDLGVLSLVKDMEVDLPLYASTYLAAMNHEAVDLLKKVGFSRIILERHLTLREISEVVRRSKDVELEVFIHGGGCSNINVSCYLYHFHFPELNQARWKIESTLAPPCMLHFDIYDVRNRQRVADDVPILDAHRYCSLCQLQDLIHTGVTGFKIEGRCNPVIYQENTTKIYRELLNFIEQGQIKNLPQELASLKTSFHPMSPHLPTLQECCCEQKRCYYTPLSHAPYTLPVSWHAWTKFQFKTMVFDDENFGANR